MNTRAIAPIIAIVLALPTAIWLGVSVAQEQVTTVAWILGAMFVILCLSLKQHVWILIPATLGMQGEVNIVPGGPTPWHVMTAAASGFTFLRILARKQDFKINWTGMETCLLLIVLTIVQAFVRNPTGLSIMGGEYAGGKAYFVFAVAMVAFVVIATADADLRSFRWAVTAYIVVTLLDSTNAIVTAFIPEYARMLVRIYSNVSFQSAFTTGFTADVTEERISQFAYLGALLSLMASTLWRPVSALDFTKPWRAVVAVGALVCAVLSGFRSQVLRVIVEFACGSALRGKYVDILAVSAAGVVATAVIIGTVPAKILPYSAQRILSVLPGTEVRSDVLVGAESSSEVRFKVWRLALLTDRFISNKILGDGFQMSAHEFAQVQASLRDPQSVSKISTEERLLITGAYHGFHAETIRCTGVVGLIAATAALIVFAIYGKRNIRYFRQHPEWNLVLFVCLPFLIAPYWYWLVFGAYKVQFPEFLAQAGMLKLLWMIGAREKAERRRLAATP